MSKFSDEVLNKIKLKLSIVDVVSSYMTLVKKNGRYWGLCPFHNEKTPSFTVSEDRGGFFKCFGCGKAGSMFDFVMESEHVDFHESVRILADRAGVQLKEQTPEESEKSKKRKTMIDLYNRITNSFHTILLSGDYSSNARDYLQKRMITDETRDKFSLGYAPDSNTWLYSFLTKHGYSDSLLNESGLFSFRHEKTSLFKNRLMFPIRNWQGDCIAFGGRSLSSDKEYKYINTPDTLIYTKRDNLFGLFESLPYIKKNEEIIICEGNFDVLSFHQAGLPYAVAPLGTALTQEQVNIIKRYCKKATLIFDSDTAGQNAAQKALLLLQKNDIENYAVTFRKAKDASELLQNYGSEGLKDETENSVQGFLYLVHLALKKYDIRQPKGRTSVFREVKPYLDFTSSEIERQLYIGQLAELLHIPVDKVVREYTYNTNRDTEVMSDNKEAEADRKIVNPGVELDIMLYLLNHKESFSDFKREIKINQLTDEFAVELYSILENLLRSENKDYEIIPEKIRNNELKQIVLSSFASDKYTQQRSAFLENAVRDLKLKNLIEDRRRIVSLISGLSNSDVTDTDSSELEELLSAKGELDIEIEKIRNK